MRIAVRSLGPEPMGLADLLAIDHHRLVLGVRHSIDDIGALAFAHLVSLQTLAALRDRPYRPQAAGRSGSGRGFDLREERRQPLRGLAPSARARLRQLATLL